MPLDPAFTLTQLTIDFADAMGVRADLYAQPYDVRGRGLDVIFLNQNTHAEMDGDKVVFAWMNDLMADRQGNLEFDAVEEEPGRYQVYYPEAMLVPGSTVTAEINVIEGERVIQIPLPTISVGPALGDMVRASIVLNGDGTEYLYVNKVDLGMGSLEDLSRYAFFATNGDSTANDFYPISTSDTEDSLIIKLDRGVTGPCRLHVVGIQCGNTPI